eukprot:scaffold90525_cov54-Phaeocystis_antarctica.AAC.1
MSLTGVSTPHRPPGPPARSSGSYCWGGARRHPPAPGVANPPGPIFWSSPIRGPDGCPSHPFP